MVFNKPRDRPVKFVFSVLLFGLLLLCGCSHRYVITLNDGTQIGTTSKPKANGGAYYFKDAMGNDRSLPTGRISEIAPASMTKDNKTVRY